MLSSVIESLQLYVILIYLNFCCFGNCSFVLSRNFRYAMSSHVEIHAFSSGTGCFSPFPEFKIFQLLILTIPGIWKPYEEWCLTQR